MKLDGKTVFVSGANRGIGKAIVEALLKTSVKKIYAGARKTTDLPDFNDSRVVPVTVDITNQAQVREAAKLAADTQLLINNAGVATFGSVVDSAAEILRLDMEVNYFGTLSMVSAFTPVLEKQNGAAIANVVSVVGLASVPMAGGYSASKSALFSATQAMRTELKAKKIDVYGIYPGPIDTDMAKQMEMQKASPAATAQKILAGIEAGDAYIFPDPMSEEVGKLWAVNPKELEAQFAAM